MVAAITSAALTSAPLRLDAQTAEKELVSAQVVVVEFAGVRWQDSGYPRSIPLSLLREVGELDGRPIFVEAGLSGSLSTLPIIYLPSGRDGEYRAFRPIGLSGGA